MGTTMRALRAGLLAPLAALSMFGCSTAPIQESEPLIEPVFPADRVLGENVTYAIDIYDPWQGFNRTMYRFNYRFDQYIFLPAVRGYQAVLPDVAEKGVHNFWNNLEDVVTIFNSVLQLKGTKALETSARFVWNSTAGLLGFLDVASHMEIPRHDEDFGQTLGRWGVGPGPYLVLPILGPSSVRDGVGLGVDFYVGLEFRNQFFELQAWSPEALAWTAIYAIDRRAHIPFRYYETGSAFEYEMVRMLYNTKRDIEVQN